ncbi:UDP-N-acetylglucosamine 2-epimerase (non-hydrolyzing) [Micromonospora sp. CPCC 206060]|uniref:non-hydrolyzing UDP-N-acetylglucosamine 2-epimerase n=1 Tax=Micromonospora sp. CPCC 206060 TaxID=3122406 RepID=UPI002FF32172
MKITVVVGIRPHFPKLAALYPALTAHHQVEIIHTGQHFDHALSGGLLDEFGLPRPAHQFAIGGGGHAEQTARGLLALDPVLGAAPPDLVLVIGDGNSTLVGALAAAKRSIPVAHVEAGLRSHEPDLPEEVNRRIIDAVTSLHLCPTEQAVRTLDGEGVRGSAFFVGDLLLDTLDQRREAVAERLAAWRSALPELKEAALVTFHRSGTLRDPAALADVVDGVRRMPCPVVCVLHPGTEKALTATGLIGALRAADHVRLLPAQPHTDLLALTAGVDRVFTDSNGVQREALFLGTPCFILRPATEYPETLEFGAGELVGTDPERIVAAARTVLRPVDPVRLRSAFGDGRAAARIADAVTTWAATRKPAR